MSYVLPFLPTLAIGIILIFLLAIFRIIHVQYRKKHRRMPHKDSELRFPGQTSLQRLYDLNGDAIYYSSSLVIVPLLICAIYILQLHVSTIQFSRVNIVLIGFLTLLLTGFILVKTVRTLKQRRLARLAYESAVSVGQELNRLMLDGYRIFHDFPAEGVCLDHIVVGSKGVFVVETKARPSAASANTGAEITVEYNGHVLYFPDGRDLQTIEKAGSQATWLSDWLGRTVGEPIATRAVVALPGWTVKRTSADGIPVVNPLQFSSLFEHIQPRHLDDEMIDRIVDRLEKQCRLYRTRSSHSHIQNQL